jgi:cystathionine beta-lyase
MPEFDARAFEPIHTLAKRRSAKWADQADGVLAMTVAEMDLPLAEPIVDRILWSVKKHDLGYPAASIQPLGEALASFAARRLQWSIDPTQVSAVPDVITGALDLCRSLLGPGGVIALPVPAYPPYLSRLPKAGFRIYEVPTDLSGCFTVTDLKCALDAGAKVLILVTPHNPTGSVFPRSMLSAVAETCAEYGACVIADEVHSPLIRGGVCHVPFLEVSDAARECGIALFSASKAFNIRGLMCAQLVTASPRTRAVAKGLDHLSSHVGVLGRHAAESAFRECDEWLDAVLALLDSNCEALRTGLATKAPQIGLMPPEGTYLAWLDCRRALPGVRDPAEVLLNRGRVALTGGPLFGRSGRGFARLNFATSPDLVDDGVDRIARSL